MDVQLGPGWIQMTRVSGRGLNPVIWLNEAAELKTVQVRLRPIGMDSR